MFDLTPVNKVIEALCGLEEKTSKVGDSLEEITGMISLYLKDYGVCKNTQNAGQIVEMILANLYPDDPLSSITLNCVSSGSMPCFSNDPPETYSLYRAAAIFVDGILDNDLEGLAKSGAEKIARYIEKSGYLPASYEE